MPTGRHRRVTRSLQNSGHEMLMKQEFSWFEGDRPKLRIFRHHEISWGLVG